MDVTGPRGLPTLPLKLGPSFGGISLKLVEVADAGFILALRTNPVLNKHISPTSPDLAAQQLWMRDYKDREAIKAEYYFVIRDNDYPVGTVRLYDFRGDSFCWGSWIITQGTHPRVATASLVMLYDFAFDTLGFVRTHFEVRRTNFRVRNFHLRMGAQIVASDGVRDNFHLKADCYRRVRTTLVGMLS